MSDIEYMRRALRLAERGAGWVNPNPQVGCVIVRDGEIIGEGWHKKYGGLHAEREALAACTRSPKGSTAYVTLEPCCHTGKQPPCCEALIEAGIKRVVMGAPDPNPLVAGKGIAWLKEAGIEVTEHVAEDECRQLNKAWMHYITTGMPYVTMKYAMTLDGKIATHCGESKWITGETARAKVHADRQAAAAVLVGIGTVLADDPLLTCRIKGQQTRNPVRVVADSNLRTPLDSQLVKTAGEVPTIIACSIISDHAKADALTNAGCTVLELPGADGTVDLKALFSYLGKHDIDSCIVEGGASMHWSLLQSGCVNRVQAYIAAKLFGGQSAPSPIGGTGVNLPSEALLLNHPTVTELGDDLLIECEVPSCSLA